MDRTSKNLKEEISDFPDLGGKTKQIPKDCQPEKRYNYRNGGARLSGSIVKELARQPEVFRTLENFQPKGGLQQREIVCGPQGISVEFSSPLEGIATPNYIKNNIRSDLISEKVSDSEEGGISSTVLAVDCKWRNGVKLINAVSRSRSRQINPDLKTVDFDFESKAKFSREIDSICAEHFPSDNVLILDGNNSHGKYSQNFGGKQQEKEVQGQTAASYGYTFGTYKQPQPRPGTNVMDPWDTKILEYNDLEEHKLLLIPGFSKSGFEANQRYSFPYTARFSINSKTYERAFQLQLPFGEAPQHFGLVFTFPEKSKDGEESQTNIVIKSMLSVFSVFPRTGRHATLAVYEYPDFEKPGASNGSKEFRQSRGRKIAKEYVANMDEHLKEEKLVPTGYKGKKFEVSYEVKGKALSKSKDHYQGVHGGNKYRCPSPDSRTQKNKDKRGMQSEIKMGSRDMH